jgi:hypothetical protein
MVGGWRPLTVAGFRLGPAFNGFDLAATDPAAIPFPADRVLWTETSLFTGYCRSLKNFWAFPAARAFSSEVETGSRQENASNQESRALFQFYRNGALGPNRLWRPVAAGLLIGLLAVKPQLGVLLPLRLIVSGRGGASRRDLAPGRPWPEGTLSFKALSFHGLRLRFGPCRDHPPSYMRLTVAISRAIDRLGVWIGAPSGPSQPAAKRRI